MFEDDKIDNRIKYIRVLGLSKNGSTYIKKLNNSLLVTSLKNLDSYVANVEIRVTNLYNTLTEQNIKADFLPPIIK